MVDEARRSIDELRLELDALRASLVRVVAGADSERRRIERDLHDGAQQHLVALAVNLQLARQLADTDSAAVKALLEEMSADVREALDGVRELAEGIYPPLLLDRGLTDALKGAARRIAIPVRVEAAALDRHPPDVESAVYFCCLEALENAARHSGATRATVRVWRENDALRFEVEDDGAGFDQTARHPDGGLTAISDRVGALAGHLIIWSEAGAGSRVGGWVPIGVS
jgi:signal transduction histidine kinase